MDFTEAGKNNRQKNVVNVKVRSSNQNVAITETTFEDMTICVYTCYQRKAIQYIFFSMTLVLNPQTALFV